MKPIPEPFFGQFLSDVLTAAGLVEHGRQSRALAERLCAGCMLLLELRAGGIPLSTAAPLQAGLDNDRLRAEWDKKVPGVAPDDRQLTAFALGAEAGFDHARNLEKNDCARLHHVMQRHGLHPGRTDDDLIEVLDRALRTRSAALVRPSVEPVWIVNDLGELGVKVGDRFFFLYKGDNIVYEEGICDVRDGVALHEDGTPMHYRIVGKREFGEVCRPAAFYALGAKASERYTKELVFTPGLSFGAKEDGDWRPLPAISIPDCQT